MGNKRNLFASKWGFIIACVGSAVGMANVWGFPYRMASNGGGAFLLCYLFFIILFSYTGLSSEYAIGRIAKAGTLGAYEYAWNSRGMHRAGKIVGWIPLIGAVCITIGYAIVISYVLKALTDSVFGTLMEVNTEEWFASFAFKTYSVVPFHIAIVIITGLTLIYGARSIEKTGKVMMPIFFLLFLILAVRVLLLPDALGGYKFMFMPDWQQLLNPMTWVWAMGQAFFSLSITGSCMIVYGSYLGGDEDIVNGAKNTAIFDTVAAVVAALVIIPATFAFGIDRGPGLLFVTLPAVLQDIPLGRIFAILLYTAVVFAGITSLQSLFEVVIESFMYKFPKLSRKIILVFLCLITLAIGIFMEPITDTKGAIMGGWGPWMDLVSIYIIPISASLGAISWFWVLKKDELLDEVNRGAKKTQGTAWYNIGKWLYTPLAIVLCIIALFCKISF